MSECEQRGFAPLADADLPPRVAEALGAVMDFTRKQLTPLLEGMLASLDNELYQCTQSSRDTFEQSRYFKAINLLKNRKDDFPDEFFRTIEDRLSQIRQIPPPPAAKPVALASPSLEWGLDSGGDSQPNHRELANPAESSANLAIYLLGQRFGVLAAAPAFSVEALPLAPRALLQAANQSSLALFGKTFPVAVLEKTFTRFVLNRYTAYIDAVNKSLEDAGVLRGLSHIPIRPGKAKPERNTSATADENASEHAARSTAPRPQTPLAPAASRPPAGFASHGMPETAQTLDSWTGQPADVPQTPTDGTVDFRLLQQLLTARRFAASPNVPTLPQKVGRVLEPSQLSALVDTLRPPPLADDQPTPRMADLQQRLLEQLRQQHGDDSQLRREDNDAIELLGLLLEAVAKEIRNNSPVHRLIGRMQWPLLRSVVEDRDFFEQDAHPARQILNTISEADARNEQGPHTDTAFEAAMQRAVGKLETEYKGERELLDEINDELQRQATQQAERARSSEKRVIEAARGRERMSMAKRMAAEALESRLKGLDLPRAILLLLRSAWLDALTLGLLRYGDDSHAWATCLKRTDAILDLQTRSGAQASPELVREIEAALERVGYHDQESANIARQLSRGPATTPDEDEPTATEMAASIKARPRFGGDEPDTVEQNEVFAPRSPREEECYRLLRTLPFGTWMDFVINQQGDISRRRLAWYSTLTDNALFVNRRGQRIAEMHMDELARSMSRDQLRITEQNKIRLVDRALSATASMLQKLLRNNVKAQPKPMPR